DHKTKNGRTIQPLQVYNSIAAMPWTDATSTYVIKPAANQADINRYISENLVQFILGQKPLDEGSWNAFIKGLDGLGVADWEQSATDQLKARGFLK
ncbi:MAG: hypothetical protein J2P36_16070, partial [Ktedonobacteraceae bacterium]|nr:hypothetical protein [Ktedonobacteraceae bacterium]